MTERPAIGRDARIRPIGAFDVALLAELHAAIFTAPWDRPWHAESLAQILAMPNLRLAVCDDPVYVPMAQFLFPKATIKLVPSEDIASAIGSGEVDGAIWTLEQASAWTEAHSGFTAIAPADMGAPILLAYMMPPGADNFRRYLDQWLELKNADGFRAAQFDYWMNGKPRSDRPPRWNLLDSLMGGK